MKKILKKTGFTLTELLVAIVILGIITLMAIPQISNLINSNNDAKYDAYKETIETSGKLYTDSYKEDMFGNNTSGCYDIPYQDMEDKKLIQDIKINNVTCKGGSEKKTFVRVYKSGEHYKYKVSILCVNKKNSSAIEYQDVIEGDTASDTTFCDGKTLDLDGPRISLKENGSTWTTGQDMKVKLTISDDFGLLENIRIKYAWTTTPGYVTNWKEKNFNNERYKTSVSLTLDVPQNKNEDYYLVVEPVMVRDANGNYQTQTFKSNVFQFDNTMPTCTITENGTKGLDNWYVTEPNITLTYDDTRGEVSGYTVQKTKATDFSEINFKNKTTATQGDTKKITWYGYIKDAAGNIVECSTNEFKVDTTPPEKPTSGKISLSGTSSSATMSEASGSTDATSGVKEYRYVIKTSSGAPENTSDDFTTSRSYTRSCGTTYYGYAIAVDNAGNKSAVYSMGSASDGADSYSDWSSCSKDCGTGTKTRTNTCALVTWDLSANCNTHDCCSSVRTEYGDWSTCTKKCGTGTKTRTVKTYSTYTGNQCTSTTETVNCNTMGCCDEVTYGDWGSYNTCSKTCGTGTKSRTRTKYSAYDSSKTCGTETDTVDCNTHTCCSSTTVSSYGSWEGCSKTCGTGKEYRDVYYKSTYDGSSCGSTNNGDSRNCNTHTCCSSTYISGYGSWEGCSKTCGGGTEYRDVYYKSSYDHSGCGSTNNGDSRSCNTQSCCIIKYHTDTSSRCWTFASTYMGGGANWSNGKLQVCTGNDSGCVAANDSRCGKIGGTYFYFKYCP